MGNTGQGLVVFSRRFEEVVVELGSSRLDISVSGSVYGGKSRRLFLIKYVVGFHHLQEN